MWAGFSGTFIPSDTVVASSGASAIRSGTRQSLAPGRSSRPPKLPGHPARHLGSKQATAGLLARGSFACRRLPRGHPSGQLTASFPPTVAGAAAEFGRKARHRIPFSLLIFEETVNFSLTKGPGAGLVNGDASPADRACGGGTPVYSSGRRRFPHCRRDARRERGEERKL